MSDFMAFNQRWKIGVLTAALAGVLSLSGGAQQPQAAAVRKIGTVKSISGNTLVLKTDAGPEVNVSVSDSARIFKLAPGQTVKDAVPAEIKDIQAGDRILVSAAAERSEERRVGKEC